nr:CCA tRNA nucleotidyltransferase [Sedimentibacter sp.]
MNPEINMPKEAEFAVNILNDNGFDAYVVGGCVRDSILGNKPSDWDITTSALPHDIIKCFENYRIIETGLKHGTVTVIISDMPLEITTYRIDGEYKDNRRPDGVTFTNDIAYDLQRRDFTINAMAYNHKNGIVDLYDGMRDIKRRLIRCVGNPDKRFEEDGLRILRALRFAAVLNFDIEHNTSNSIRENKKLLYNISSERITVEFNKLITGSNFKKILTDYIDVIGVFIPEIQPNDSWNHTMTAMSNVTDNLILRLAVLFYNAAKLKYPDNNEENKDYHIKLAKIYSDMVFYRLQSLKYDNKTSKIVKDLILYYDAEIRPTSDNIKRWLNKTGIEIFEMLLEIKKAHIRAKDDFAEEKLYDINQIEFIFKKIINEKQCFNLKDLAVNGSNLIDIGLPKGKYIGEILNELLTKVIDEELENEKGKLLNYVINKNTMVT